MAIIGIYPGRFQIFAHHHRQVVKKICLDYGLDILYVLVADWPVRTRENPLTGSEAVECASLSLANLGRATEVLVRPFLLSPSGAFDEQFRMGIVNFKPNVVFSGSASTLTAARLCAGDLGLTVVELVERGACHSTQIRQWIESGNQDWRGWVEPEAVDFIESLNLPQRLRSLGEGDKRPWVGVR